MDATLFVSVVIIALTQIVKMALPGQVHKWLTILVAIVMGVLVAVFDTSIGIVDVSIAEGIVAALGAIGITTAAGKASDSGVPGDAR